MPLPPLGLFETLGKVQNFVRIILFCTHPELYLLFQLFVRHIGRFVDDINNAELLNLFVASLNNDNVTEGMYGDSYSDSRVHRAIKNGKTKVV